METQTVPNNPTSQQTPANGSTHANGTAHAQPRRYVRPRASITESADGFTVQVEMPGVNQAGLEITFENGELTLVGHRSHDAGSGDGHEVLYRESHPSDYRRAFEVDNTIDASRISARLDQGLLTLSLPKAEAAKPRRIEISGLN